MNMTEARRTRIDIFAAILESSLEGSRKTRIMYRANVNQRDLTTILDLLIRKGLLEVAKDKSSSIYKATAKGRNFIESYRKLNETLS